MGFFRRLSCAIIVFSMPSRKKLFVILISLGLALIAFFLTIIILDKESNNGGGVEVVLSLDKPSYKYGDTLLFRSRIKNKSISIKSFEFGTTCTSGQIILDGKPLMNNEPCGDALKTLDIPPLGKEEYEYDFKLVDNFTSIDPSSILYSEETEREKANPGYEEIQFYANGNEVRLAPGLHTARLEWYEEAISQEIQFTVE